MTLWGGWPVGEPKVHRVHFVDGPPDVGDVTESFSGLQWRVVKVRPWKDRWEVTEVKLEPADYVKEPEWVMRSPREP